MVLFKRDVKLLNEMMIHLYGWLGDDTKSMSTAAAFLKEQMGLVEYTTTLMIAGVGHLSEAVRLFEEFDLVQGGYYLRTA